MNEIPRKEDFTTGKLFDILGDKLDLEKINGVCGHGRQVESEDISRPGMALTGYMHKFLHERIQIFGETEISYLDSLSPERRESALKTLFDYPVYCSIVTKGLKPPDELCCLSKLHDSALFSSQHDTTPLIHDLSSYLALVFAPLTKIHGSLVEVYGAGILCTGRSAIGKSETVLGLLERGHRLIADDIVHIRRINDTLVGSGDPKIAQHMEIRGLGFIDVSAFYGIRSVKDRQKINLEVKLEAWSRDNQEFDRTGLVQRMNMILDVPIPRTIIPVLPGRNLTLLFEVAVMNYLLLEKGRNVPEEIEKNLIERIMKKELRNDNNEFGGSD